MSGSLLRMWRVRTLGHHNSSQTWALIRLYTMHRVLLSHLRRRTVVLSMLSGSTKTSNLARQPDANTCKSAHICEFRAKNRPETGEKHAENVPQGTPIILILLQCDFQHFWKFHHFHDFFDICPLPPYTDFFGNIMVFKNKLAEKSFSKQIADASDNIVQNTSAHQIWAHSVA